MKYLVDYLRYISYLFVFIGFSLAHAGSYDDFFQAVMRDDDAKVSQLIARGFDANTMGSTGAPGLLIAIREPSPKVIGVLLKAPGIRAEVRNAKDESALMLAALAGMRDVCARLIALDADVNKTGWTPLHYAATGGHDAVIRLLLEHYAYIDAESPNQTTPLMMAAMYGTPSSVTLLLDAGADAKLRNAAGLSALDFAQRGQRPESQAIIERYLAIMAPQ
jgi:ankyrin repeat protein